MRAGGRCRRYRSCEDAHAGWVKLDVPYVPTSPAVIEAMMKVANVGPDDIVYDLGSGDGRISIAAVLQNKAQQAVGIELNPNRVADAVANRRGRGPAQGAAATPARRI